MGKRMVDAGGQMWPDEAPVHTPAVVTHEKRDNWERVRGDLSWRGPRPRPAGRYAADHT